MSDDNQEYQNERGWRFPAGVAVPKSTWFSYTIGGNEIEDQRWYGHVDLAHQHGATGIDTEVVDSGVDADGIRYAVVKATVHFEDGSFSALQAADETTNQVRDPEYVWAVAESRALKRAVKKALNIIPADETVASADPTEGDTPGSSSREPDVAIDADPDPQPPQSGPAGGGSAGSASPSEDADW